MSFVTCAITTIVVLLLVMEISNATHEVKIVLLGNSSSTLKVNLETKGKCLIFFDPVRSTI